MPEAKKFVLIGAPHTTNWDLPIALLSFWSLSRRFYWVAKKQIFIGPFGYLFRALGGIPIDRSSSHGFIQQITEQFEKNEEMILCIAPEGTRSRTKTWKTGFYYIALSADIPICLGYVDFQNKTVGFGQILIPSGDIEKDFEQIKNFYKDKKGKFPEKQGPIEINRPNDKTA